MGFLSLKISLSRRGRKYELNANLNILVVEYLIDSLFKRRIKQEAWSAELKSIILANCLSDCFGAISVTDVNL